MAGRGDAYRAVARWQFRQWGCGVTPSRSAARSTSRGATLCRASRGGRRPFRRSAVRGMEGHTKVAPFSRSACDVKSAQRGHASGKQSKSYIALDDRDRVGTSHSPPRCKIAPMSKSLPSRLGLTVVAVSGAVTLLGGCQTAGERMMARAARQDTCGAKRLQVFVGRKADQTTREAIQRDMSDARRLRWIAPGDEILADLNTGRTSILLNDVGVIKSVGCY
ncbi:hypothetical protein E5A73_14500 [Sphingomonas gei]|uniref:Peptidase inhibitor I78 family protein n=1 Tax=Sphingomonas gei TaxID=1395960 RepID=A0A4S1XBU9_9SPHN|nr:hypothetical protein E5A73_14500 [Sphingomonas gei]